MNTDYKPRFTSKELSAQITERIQELAEATDTARVSEAMIEYLDMCARFHRYSPNNLWLILMAKPEATMIAGYHKWRGMGRYVMRGEKGIAILAPVIVKDKDDIEEHNKKLVGFKVVYVFDVSQTDGESMPHPPDWKSPEQNALLAEKLIRLAEKKDIKVNVKELAGNTQGISAGGSIEIAPEAGTKTLIHEIAHELMHRGEDRPKDHRVRELEAEAVAFVVGTHFGLEGISSPNYVALHGAGSEMIMQHIGRIRSSAAEIITKLENVHE